MKLKTAIGCLTERKIGSKSDGTMFVTLPKGSFEKGEKVLLVKKDENTMIINRNKTIYVE